MKKDIEELALAYKQNPTREAMEEVLPDLELIIDSSNGVQKVLPLDSFFSTEETTNLQKEEN